MAKQYTMLLQENRLEYCSQHTPVTVTVEADITEEDINRAFKKAIKNIRSRKHIN